MDEKRVRRSGLLRTIDGAHQVLPGVRTRHLQGQTPGHQAIEVVEGGASLLLWDDAINHTAQLRQPGLATGPTTTSRSPCGRRRLLGELVDSGRVLAPPHFAEPFGRLVSEGPSGGIAWLPMA